MVIMILKTYLICTIIIMLLYTIRHFIFAYNRLYGVQRLYYQDIIDSEFKTVTVLIPMHNEAKVARNILDLLLQCDYDVNKLEIIPINDFSEDETKTILDEYQRKYPIIKPIHRYEGDRGKPAALNTAMKVAKGEIIIVFDADYLPPKGILKKMVLTFNDPEAGAVMGRVVPINTKTNLLTRLLDLERSGGYQVDQQARYNMGLIPQYGGTVGGYRKKLIIDTGGFNVKILAEDTELTFRLYVNGWKVIYANSAECYEEVPESWTIRSRQIQRWSRGHNEVMFRYFYPLLSSTFLNWKEKIDGFMLLMIYCMPVILLFGMVDSVLLFFFNEMDLFIGWWVLLFIGVYNTFGNFAPFYQVGSACLLDGTKDRVYLLPFLIFNFYYYMWYITCGFFDTVLDKITYRKAVWHKTERAEKSAEKEINSK